MHITLILPIDFQFKISKERLISRCSAKPISQKLSTIFMK